LPGCLWFRLTILGGRFAGGVRVPEKTLEKNAMRLRSVTRVLLLLSIIALCGCDDLVPRDTSSLLVPRLHRSEIIGFLAGLGTTFAALPDLLSMLKRRSSAGMNPRMAAIMGVFQFLWVYYGLLIASRPVIAWNVLAILINFVSVAAYRHFARKEAANRTSA
jgi:uncharacterized protein with PQ loop repeat